MSASKAEYKSWEIIKNGFNSIGIAICKIIVVELDSFDQSFVNQYLTVVPNMGIVLIMSDAHIAMLQKLKGDENDNLAFPMILLDIVWNNVIAML